MNGNVEVIRYVRGYNGNEISNMHGITLIYEINYETGLVAVSWSVCHGTNFSRKEGISVARKNNQKMYLTFGEVEKGGDLTTAVFMYLSKWDFLDIWSGDDYSVLRTGLNHANKILKGF
jgi:hypothetical protein